MWERQGTTSILYFSFVRVGRGMWEFDHRFIFYRRIFFVLLLLCSLKKYVSILRFKVRNLRTFLEDQRTKFLYDICIGLRTHIWESLNEVMSLFYFQLEFWPFFTANGKFLQILVTEMSKFNHSENFLISFLEQLVTLTRSLLPSESSDKGNPVRVAVGLIKSNLLFSCWVSSLQPKLLGLVLKTRKIKQISSNAEIERCSSPILFLPDIFLLASPSLSLYTNYAFQDSFHSNSEWRNLRPPKWTTVHQLIPCAKTNTFGARNMTQQDLSQMPRKVVNTKHFYGNFFLRLMVKICQFLLLNFFAVLWVTANSLT